MAGLRWPWGFKALPFKPDSPDWTTPPDRDVVYVPFKGEIVWKPRFDKMQSLNNQLFGNSTREKLGNPSDLQLLQKTFDRMK